MIRKIEKYDTCGNVAYIVANVDKIKSLGFGEKETEYLCKTLEKKDYATLNLYDRMCFFVKPNAEKSVDEQRENVRMNGCSISDALNAQKYTSLCIVDHTENGFALDLAEGIELANYRFDKYLKEKKTVTLSEINIVGNVDDADIVRLNSLVDGVFIARDIINEPLSYMTAKKLSEEIERLERLTRS